MAIIFLEKKQKQRYFILALAGTILLVILVIWQNLFTVPLEPTPSPAATKPTKIEITLDVFKSQAFKDLRPFEEIKPYEDELGRKNPFVSASQ